MRTIALSVFLCVGLLAASALAQGGNAENGAVLAKKMCSCHNSKKDIDGKPEADLVKKMKAYKAGQGEPKMMVTLAAKLSDQDILDSAAYYAGRK